MGVLVNEVVESSRVEHHPDGFNIGINVGEAAGQTVAHAHMHVVPRYNGDVDDLKGGVRWVVPEKAAYWK
jgi:diadenosine tetraphosphate (Ap4A) HIT family hydrolase